MILSLLLFSLGVPLDVLDEWHLLVVVVLCWVGRIVLCFGITFGDFFWDSAINHPERQVFQAALTFASLLTNSAIDFLRGSREILR